MLWNFLEYTLNLILVAGAFVFVQGYGRMNSLTALIAGIGFIALGILSYRLAEILIPPPKSKKSKSPTASRKAPLTSTMAVRMPEALTLQNVSPQENSYLPASALGAVDFIETETVESFEPHGPFNFIVKRPIPRGQSQLAAIDALVGSLPKANKKTLVVSDISLSSTDGTVLNALRNGKRVQNLYCYGLYNNVDLLPNLGVIGTLEDRTRKAWMELIGTWANQYDQVIFQMNLETLREVRNWVQSAHIVTKNSKKSNKSFDAAL